MIAPAQWSTRAQGWIFSHKHALQGVAASRIVIGLSILTLLLANFAQRDIIFGPGSVWAGPVRASNRFPEVDFLTGVSSDVLSLIYLIVLAAASAFTVGWHTRIAGVVTLLGFIGITGQNPLLAGQSDDILRLVLLWMLFLHSSGAWSVDEYRRETKPTIGDMGDDGKPVSALRSAWNSHPVISPGLTTGIHNVALVGLSIQVAIIYTSAAIFRLQSEFWRDGTALYYSLQLPNHGSFRWLNNILTTNGFVVVSLTYAILLVQLLFVPLLLSRLTRPVAIVAVIATHLFVAVVLAAPWSSFGMIACVLIFVAGRTYRSVDRRTRTRLSLIVADGLFARESKPYQHRHRQDSRRSVRHTKTPQLDSEPRKKAAGGRPARRCLR